ncbi:hypothetical protein GSI_02575 [Ganoderma sinense ZZ0214-1]|uniref:Uncharacterized protein n=1 Tax=Ganoderma sinense ZZ0214-1 TaxID=1077348 RepID=A0A2G8SMI9_9APHY|nr:hypothetical protein GSI_02575 [Ganoderma sinense ZZ0214-1]
MRLLNTSTGELQDFPDESLPRYAILSHVWQTDELSFEDLRALHTLLSSSPTSGLDVLSKTPSKIRECCRVAREYGYSWVWIDTCCIDKSSSAELSEAINSMFAWYKCADACFAFLHDVDEYEDPCAQESSFRQSKWWTRGWTLQELLAPSMVVFFSRTWRLIGTKASLAQLVHEITGIQVEILVGARPIHRASVAQRMSWAAKRVTTRIEDRAYSLLGIFDVHMPTIYGEGSHAFIRLQEEILLRTDDQTIFCWGDFLHSHSSSTRSASRPLFRRALKFGQPGVQSTSLALRDLTLIPFSGCTESTPLLAHSPDCFANSSQFETLLHHDLTHALGHECAPPEYRRLGTKLRMEAPFMKYEETIYGWRRGFTGMVLRCQADGKVVVLFLSRRNETPRHHYDLGMEISLGQRPFLELRGLLIPLREVRGALDSVDVRPVILPITTPSDRSAIWRLSRPVKLESPRAKYLATSVVISDATLCRLHSRFGLRPHDPEHEAAHGVSSGLVITIPPVEILAYKHWTSTSVCILNAQDREAFTLTIGTGCPCRARQKANYYGLDLLWVSVKAPSPLARERPRARAHPESRPCSRAWHFRDLLPRPSLGFTCVVGGPVRIRGTPWAVKLSLFRLPTANVDEPDSSYEGRRWLMDIDSILIPF